MHILLEKLSVAFFQAHFGKLSCRNFELWKSLSHAALATITIAIKSSHVSCIHKRTLLFLLSAKVIHILTRLSLMDRSPGWHAYCIQQLTCHLRKTKKEQNSVPFLQSYFIGIAGFFLRTSSQEMNSACFVPRK